MKWKPVAGIVLRQIYLLRGSPVRVFPMITWVAIDMVLWGFLTRYLNSVSARGVDFVPALLGGVLLWDFCTRIMQGVSTAFLEDVWSRNFLNLFSSPLSISEYITGLVITSIMTSALGLITMLLIANGVFHLEFFSLGLALGAFLMILFIFGITLGICGAAIVLRFGPASEWLLWPLPALLSPFAAVFYPLKVLPSWMQGVALALPPSYVFEGMRALLASQPFPGGLLLEGSLISIVELILAGVLYGRIYRHAVRTGLLARYSAEGAA
ncbi:MAG TPA: ABC transporter permease [Steroidobacteraceae bacterium]|nr:ABC transporter permease [Steroidobacteraceae bacterium]